MKKEVKITQNISFSEIPLDADLFQPPEGEENGAAIVIVHGGGWREGDKTQLGGYGLLLAREGFVCLCTSYRLSQEERWPAQIRKYENSDVTVDAYKALMGDEAQQEDYDLASPLLQIQEDFPPTMLIHGSTDSVVSLSDSTDLYDKLTNLGVPTELHIFSEEEHAFDSQSGYGRLVAELQNLFFKKYL